MSSPSTVTVLGKPVGPVAFGLMGFTWRHTITSPEDAMPVMQRALAHGANFWNAGEFYGPPTNPYLNLELVKRYFTAHPADADRVVLSVKGGIDLSSGVPTPRGDAAAVRRSVDNVLAQLGGAKFVDIFECARVDAAVPIETTVAALAEYVRAGRIGGIGLSEASAATIRRAHAVHPIAAVEVEVSLWERAPLAPGGVLDTCAELGIPVAAYAPLAMGFLAGALRTRADLDAADMRRAFERFSEDNFDSNARIADAVRDAAAAAGVSPAQLCIEWVRVQGEKRGGVVIPLTGVTTAARADENFARVEVGAEALEAVGKVVEEMGVSGGRYMKAQQAYLLL